MGPFVIRLTGREIRARKDRRVPNYRYITREFDRDLYIFARSWVAPFVRLWILRWQPVYAVTQWLMDHGVMEMPEDGYFHEAEWRSPRRWFRGSGILPPMGA